MRISIDIEGDLKAMMAAEIASGERAVSGTLRGRAAMLKSDWRGQVASAGLGGRLANTVRSQVYPAQPSLNAAGLVYTKAPKIIGAHESGAVITAKNGFWLAIPLPGAGKGRGGGKITPGEWETRTGRRLRFIYRAGRTALLVDDGTVRSGNAPAFGERRKRGFRNRTVPIFYLTPQVKLRKKLNLFPAAEAVASGIPAEIVARWRASR